MVAWWVWVIGLVAVILLIGTFVPLPNQYNVTVEVTAVEVSIIVAAIFEIASVSGQTTGQSSLFDWSALGAVTWFTVSATFTMTVCVEGNHCQSKSSNQWFPSVPILNGGSPTATTSFSIGYVPAQCNAQITVTLTQQGNGSPTTGSGAMNVGPGC